MKDTALLERTMQHIKDHPEKHDQHSTFHPCGTPGCFVGWAMHFDGLTADDFYDMENVDSSYEWFASRFDIGVHDAAEIWCPGNTVAALELMIKDLVNDGKLDGDSCDYLNRSENI